MTAQDACMRLWEDVQSELLACYGEGEDTDWPYLNDLTDLIVELIGKYGDRMRVVGNDGSGADTGDTE